MYKFEIGEVVASKSSVEGIAFVAWTKVDRPGIVPALATVISREAEECSGGVQLHYLVRVGWESKLIRVNEVELLPLSEALKRWRELQEREDEKIK